MKLEVWLSPEYTEPTVLILADRMTEELDRLLKRLSPGPEPPLLGFREGTAAPLDEASITRIYAQSGQVLAMTDRGEYQMRQRLYELEERLSGGSFVRISNSELINLRRVRSFDLGITGTICVRLTDGSTAWASRRYVSKIRTMLGL